MKKSEGASAVSQGSQKSQTNTKVKTTISRAEAIQQREQLRQMILSKFLQDYAKKGNKKNQQLIENEVDNFFRNEKITEENLRNLKNRITNVLAGAKPSASQVGDNAKDNGSQVQQAQEEKALSVKSGASKASRKSEKPQQQQKDRQSDTYSIASSSKAPQSVYYLEGDEDDEWATLVKFDTELFKKEQELEKVRKEEFKKKIKNELDRQLMEKSRRKGDEVQEEGAYVSLQHDQLNAFDRRQKEKEEERKRKILNEKKQRDKQVADENSRKKYEKKREKQLDEMLVQRIKEEKEMEERDQKNKREKEKQRLHQMMEENEVVKAKTMNEERQEKENDIRLQQEYTRLLVEMEERREEEKRQREEKIKKIMSSFADTVVKDQKAVIRDEDEKMLKHIRDTNERANEEERRKQEAIKKQKEEMRNFLNKQMDDKNHRKVQEDQVNHMQADIWAKDRENFMEHERQKEEYIKSVNKKHQDILNQQIEEKQGKKKRGKMDVTELLQNKSRLKEIAEKNPELAANIKKAQQPEIVR